MGRPPFKRISRSEEIAKYPLNMCRLNLTLLALLLQEKAEIVNTKKLKMKWVKKIRTSRGYDVSPWSTSPTYGKILMQEKAIFMARIYSFHLSIRLLHLLVLGLSYTRVQPFNHPVLQFTASLFRSNINKDTWNRASSPSPLQLWCPPGEQTLRSARGAHLWGLQARPGQAYGYHGWEFVGWLRSICWS